MSVCHGRGDLAHATEGRELSEVGVQSELDRWSARGSSGSPWKPRPEPCEGDVARSDPRTQAHSAPQDCAERIDHQEPWVTLGREGEGGVFAPLLDLGGDPVDQGPGVFPSRPDRPCSRQRAVPSLERRGCTERGEVAHVALLLERPRSLSKEVRRQVVSEVRHDH